MDKTELLKKMGYSTDPTLHALELKLSTLAAQWRGTQSDKVVRQYHAVLKCLLELGWDSWLDVDSELPDRLMPKEYFSRQPVSESSHD